MNMGKLLLFCLFIITMASCSVQKNRGGGLNYLENIRDTAVPLGTAVPNPVIQKNDLLSIRVYSMSIDPRTDLPYNLPEQAVAGTAGTTTSGFLVDQNGNIEYPRIGTVHAEGLTKEQLADQIKGKLSEVLKSPSVIVRFANYKVTVLGEVRSPSTYTFVSERVTILDAIGMAGDISEFGKRNNVKVMREQNGKREIGTIDLTSGNMFASPYYNLQQNDVVFVEQSDRRIRQQDRQDLFQNISLATSIITTIAIILNFVK
jgi:polysaccharide biosynthesis/export protein